MAQAGRDFLSACCEVHSAMADKGSTDSSGTASPVFEDGHPASGMVCVNVYFAVRWLLFFAEHIGLEFQGLEATYTR